MKRLLADVLDRLPYVGRLRRLARSQGNVPAGHYYSPVPDRGEVLDYFNSPHRAQTEMPEIDLQVESHLERLRAYSALYAQVPFPEQKAGNCRYYYDQSWFNAPDAIFLYCFLRENRPSRIVEVGSGFSSAVMLDTADRFLDPPPEITCIDPDPGRLVGLLQPGDRERITLIQKKVQDAPFELFASLRAGDLLFVDSSHVVKCGSDVQFLLFEVLPRLASGVFVHFHDVFFPFEYPAEWLARGTYLNEAYFLRAFLAYNRRWRIHFFNGYAALAGRNLLAQRMPHCLREPGSSLYICAST